MYTRPQTGGAPTAGALPYPPLPTLDPRTADEPIAIYGQRIVLFLIASGACTATLSTEDLELAAHTITGLAPACYGDATRQRLTDLQHVIATVVRFRKTEEAPGLTLPAPLVEKPNEGPMAPLRDVPDTRPPAPSYAVRTPVREPDIAF